MGVFGILGKIGRHLFFGLKRIIDCSFFGQLPAISIDFVIILAHEFGIVSSCEYLLLCFECLVFFSLLECFQIFLSLLGVNLLDIIEESVDSHAVDMGGVSRGIVYESVIDEARVRKR